MVLSCFTCGLRKYGSDAEKIVHAAEQAEAEFQRKVEQAEAEFQRKLEAERLAREEAERLEAERKLEAERLAVEELTKSLVKQTMAERRWNDAEMRRSALATARTNYLATGVDPNTVCDSPWCTNPRVGNSRYCSDKCTDDLPRYKYTLRKKGLA